MKASLIPPSECQRVLLYGPPKGGKTLLALQLAEFYNIIMFSLENGHGVVKQLPIAWQERIEVINIPDTRSNPIAAETALKVIKGGEHHICDMHGKVTCMDCMKYGRSFVKVRLDGTLPKDTIVIWDTLTQYTNSCIAHITREQEDLYKLQTDDWGNLAVLIDIFLSHVQAARYHCICISHEIEAELEDGKKRIVPVAGSRNSSRNTAKYFDHVVYCQVKNGGHRFGSSTLYEMNVLTGSRTNARMEDMATASLIDIMQGKVEKLKIPTPGEMASNALGELAVKLDAKDNPLNKLKRGNDNVQS